MAITAEELRILVKAETGKAVTELNRFKKTSQNTTSSLKDMAKKLIGPLSITAGIALLAKGAVNFVKDGIRLNAQLEQLNVTFETILGSTSAAADMMEQLTAFSSSTPLQLTNLADGAKRLIAFGTAAEDVVGTMRNLGNAAQGNQETLDRLVNAYGKVQAKGKASLEELNMFTEAGVPIMAQLAENLGLTNAELFKFVSAGKVGFKEVDDALRSMTTGEGQFAGLLEKQSKTLTGATSTMKDNMGLLKAEILEGLTPALTKGATALSEHAQKMRESIAASNAYMRVLAGATFEVDALALAEQEAYTAQRIRDTEEAITGLEKKLEERTGKSFFGGILDAWDAGMKLLTGIERDRSADLIDQLRYLDTIVTREKARLAVIKDQIAEKRGTTDVEIPLAGTGGTGAGGATVNLDNPFLLLPSLTSDVTLAMRFQKRLTDSILENAQKLTLVPPKILSYEGDLIETEIDRAIRLAEELLAMRAAIVDNEALPAMMKFSDPLENQTAKVNTLTLGLGGLQLAMLNVAEGAPIVTEALRIQNTEMMNNANNWAAMVAAIDAYKAKQAELDKEIKNIGESLKKNLIDLLLDSTLQLFRDMGEASTAMGEGTKTAADAWGDFKTAIMNALPQILLAVGTALIQTGDPTMMAIGLGAILASFAASYFAGRNAGSKSNAAGSYSSTPSPDALRIARTYEGNTTYIHADGSIFTTDEMEALSINANAMAAGRK